MSFQSTVRQVLASGIVGEILFDGPHRVKPLKLYSGGVANTVGNAFTHDASVDGEAGVGSIGAGAFAGILVHPKSYASYGTSAGGPLAATLDLPDNAIAEIMTMGTIVVNLTIVGTGKIGEGIFYMNATGALGSGTASTGQTQITNAKIDRENVSGAGLAIITLTEAK